MTCFISLSHEIDTIPILRRLVEMNKKIYVPKTLPEYDMEFIELLDVNEIEEFPLSRFKIHEPPMDDPNRAHLCVDLDADCMIIPGVGFSDNGGRTGYGGGHFDRYFEKLFGLYDSCEPRKTRPCLIGVGLNCQFVENCDDILMEEHDTYLDAVVVAGWDTVLVGGILD